MDKFKIENKWIGEGCPTYVIAEMSGNHGGDINQALKIVRAAKEVGADALKLQTYTADTITLPSNKPDFQIPASNPWSQHSTLHELYQKAYTPWDWHKPLFEEACKVGITIFSSPFDDSAVDLLESLGAPAYKIASPEITDMGLLERVAKTGKPVIVSTGVAEFADIELAVNTLRKAGCKNIVLLKCTASYPAPPESINLLTMPDMALKFKTTVGLSDHTLGIGVPVAAVALGARVIEKHFILEKTDKSVDGFFSLDQKEFTEMVSEIRKVEKALGQVTYTLDDEGKKNFWGRRSLYISRNVKKGDLVSRENVRSVRPFYGLHPKHLKEVLGGRFTKDLEMGDRLNLQDIERKK